MPMTFHCRRLQGKRIHCLIAFLFAWVSWSGPAVVAEETSRSPRLTFTKEFKGSTPEYLAIAVEATGAATYEGRRFDEPSHPRALQLSPATTSRLFELAARLGYFHSLELENHKGVANPGLKTFRYEKDGETNQVQFNYTLSRDANDLANWFERISCVMQHQVALEFAMKYDHLSLPSELLQIKQDLAHKGLADPELLVPVLEQIAQNARYLNVAKNHAQDILRQLEQKR
jgi:hypothetical protein